MRFVLVRSWAVLAAATLTGALADALVDRDDQHQAVVPALTFGAGIALALLLYVLLTRITRRDPLLTRMNDMRLCLADRAVAFCGSVFCVVAMEGYETRFGGVSPFDPRSVVLTHTLALVIAFTIVGTLLHCFLRAAIRAASRAGTVVAELVVAFLRRGARCTASATPVSLSAFASYVPHRPLDRARASRGLRAPPHSLRSLHFIAT